MAVSQSASCSSIDLAGLPARILEALSGLDAVCREPLAAAPCAAAFEEAELRVRESANALGCEVLGGWVEGLDDGALRVERTGQCWFRVAATVKTIMSTLEVNVQPAALPLRRRIRALCLPEATCRRGATCRACQSA